MQMLCKQYSGQPSQMISHPRPHTPPPSLTHPSHTPHPLPQILVELAELQDAEVGDGTTSVVILAAELLKRANELVRNRIHPTNIISGYRLAMREVGSVRESCCECVHFELSALESSPTASGVCAVV